MGGSAEKVTRRRRPRRCVGCGKELSKTSLLRIVRSPDGVISVDPTGRKPGRGAYLCHDAECVKLAKKRKAISRALKCPVDNDLHAQLEEICAVQDETGA